MIVRSLRRSRAWKGVMDRPSFPRVAVAPPNGRDQIFAVPAERIADFDFGEKTAAVFDDMLERSVPFYDEMQRMIGELTADYAADGTAVYDLGCSTGTTILQVAENIPRERNVRYIGVDSSPEMLEIARRKLSDSAFDRPFDLECADLTRACGSTGPRWSCWYSRSSSSGLSIASA